MAPRGHDTKASRRPTPRKSSAIKKSAVDKKSKRKNCAAADNHSEDGSTSDSSSFDYEESVGISFSQMVARYDGPTNEMSARERMGNALFLYIWKLDRNPKIRRLSSNEATTESVAGPSWAISSPELPKLNRAASGSEDSEEIEEHNATIADTNHQNIMGQGTNAPPSLTGSLSSYKSCKPSDSEKGAGEDVEDGTESSFAEVKRKGKGKDIRNERDNCKTEADEQDVEESRANDEQVEQDDDTFPDNTPTIATVPMIKLRRGQACTRCKTRKLKCSIGATCTHCANAAVTCVRAA